MIRMGLTGSIATGKSTIAEMLLQAGAVIVDADQLVHQLSSPGQAAFQRIIEAFGPDILTPEGQIDREKLEGIVFHQASERQRLNAIVHPLVREAMQLRITEIAEKEKALEKNYLVVLVIPLLYESNLAHMVDLTVVVYCPERLQLKRLMERNGLSEAEALARIRSQISIEDKVRKADEVIDNSTSREVARTHLNLILGGLTWDPYITESQNPA